MFRMIKANTDNMNSKEVHQLLGDNTYEQLYKQCCLLVDDEITNQYGDVDVKYDPGDCTAVQDGDTATITSQIYAEFTTENGNAKKCYAEVESVWNGSKVTNSKVTHFDDEVDYQ